MGVSIVYLGKNDDDNEMRGMCTAIAAKLRRAAVDVQETNPNTKELPRATRFSIVKFGFVDTADSWKPIQGIRKFSDGNLGGFR